MELNVLGTEYNFIETTDREDKRLCGRYGACDIFNKDILIAVDYDTSASHATRNVEELKADVKRHEIIHAFFCESGIDDSDREWLVDWIARQFPKMMKAFQQTGCL